MTQVSPEGNSYFREDTLLENTSELSTKAMILYGISTLPEESLRGPTEGEEYDVLLTREAANLTLAVGVSNDAAVKTREVNRFLENANYHEQQNYTPQVALSRQAFIASIVETLEMKTRTETAAALKAQNEAFRQQLEGIKEIAKTLPPESLLALAPYLKLPAGIDIDAEEFANEVQDALTHTHSVPSTAELEAIYDRKSDETASPARGISLLGQWTASLFKR